MTSSAGNKNSASNRSARPSLTCNDIRCWLITGLAAHDVDDDGQASSSRQPEAQRVQEPKKRVTQGHKPKVTDAVDQLKDWLKVDLDKVVLDNLGELFQLGTARWKKYPSDICRALGVVKASEIESPNQALKDLRKLWGDGPPQLPEVQPEYNEGGSLVAPHVSEPSVMKVDVSGQMEDNEITVLPQECACWCTCKNAVILKGQDCDACRVGQHQRLGGTTCSNRDRGDMIVALDGAIR